MNEPDELTDDEAVEAFREQMQALVDRAAEDFREGKPSVGAFLRKEEASGRHTNEVVTVFASDLREVGSFLLDVPRGFEASALNYARKQWVYERISDKMAFVLSLASRRQLQSKGYATIPAFKPKPKN